MQDTEIFYLARRLMEAGWLDYAPAPDGTMVVNVADEDVEPGETDRYVLTLDDVRRLAAEFDFLAVTSDEELVRDRAKDCGPNFREMMGDMHVWTDEDYRAAEREREFWAQWWAKQKPSGLFDRLREK